MKKHPLLIVTIIIGILSWNVLNNYSALFKFTEKNYGNTAVNLSANTTADELTHVLNVNEYMKDSVDARFVAEHIVGVLQEGNKPASLMDLNKRVWQIPCSVIDSIGTPYYKYLDSLMRQSIGLDEEFYKISDTNELQSSTTVDSKHNGEIRVVIKAKDENAGAIKQLLRQNKINCPNVIVRLSEQYLDSLNISKSRVIAYAKTDSKGVATFKGLDTNLSYSVLPIRDGYEYGTPQGTIGGNLASCDDKGMITCSFTQEELKLRIFESGTLQKIKIDHTITIRSPQAFKLTFSLYVALFVVAWWILAFVYKRKQKRVDMRIPALIMLLTGICITAMFSMTDPLVGRLYGTDSAQGIIIGVLIMTLLQAVDFKRLYQGLSPIGFDIPMEMFRWFFRPYRTKVTYLTRQLSDNNTHVIKKIFALIVIIITLPLLLLDLLCITRLSNKINTWTSKIPGGTGYLLLAIFLTMLLFTPLGVSVGGMRVNLNIGILFQPSEIAKYLIVIFMAAYFSINADKIIKYSEKGNIDLLNDKIKSLATILIGMVTLVLLYLRLGDMGPAMVLTFTFILLYSIVKSKVELKDLRERTKLRRIFTCDTAMLVYGVVSYILFLSIGSRFAPMWLMCIAWFAMWIALGWVKKQIYESAILFNLIISAFIFGAAILGHIPPLHSVAERLESRNEMCTNTWGTLPIDNQIADAGENTQVAEGLWGLASGGLFGQGLGKGAPDFIPAFHTDMILESMGEQIGFVGILLIILFLSMLLYYTIVVGYRTSHPFTFYMCTGIAIVTAVQFIIISLGSTGIIPLTGVTVPFFSYGKVSMILNLTAFGIVLSIARHNAIEEANEPSEVSKLSHDNILQYNYPISLMNITYCIIAAFIIGIFFNYQVLQRDKILIRPVYVNNTNGVPIINYNPRIMQISNILPSGNIIDRNGVIVASSDTKSIKEYSEIYNQLGLDYSIDKIQSRYYPFGNHLFFMVGDINNQIFFNSNNRGYMAESRHIDMVRGYDNTLYDKEGNKVKVKLTSDEYRPDKYFTNTFRYRSPYNIQLRNYSSIIPYIKEGMYSSNSSITANAYSSMMNKLGLSPQDVQLTLDAVLQTNIQNRLTEHVPKDNILRNRKNLRISVVILDTKKGDLLTSACYPLPDYQRLLNENGNDKAQTTYTDMDLGLMYSTPPGSSAKIMSSIAGLKGLGSEKISTISYRYHPQEHIGYEYKENKNRPVYMKDAVEYSSNFYFIKLINEYDLYDELYDVYAAVGARLGHSYYNPTRSIFGQSYTLFYNDADTTQLAEVFSAHSDGAVEEYQERIEKKRTDKLNDHPAWFWAWGQGTLDTSPLTMARVASIPTNSGDMPITRYLISDEVQSVDMMNLQDAQTLKSYMEAEAKRHNDKFKISNNVAGKTGTAERIFKGRKVNDAWYICTVDDVTLSSVVNGNRNSENTSIAIAVRIECLNEREMSGNAVKVVNDVVFEALKDCEYIK